MSDVQSGGPAGMLPFIYGHVDPTLFPEEQLTEAAAEALARYPLSALSYGAALGCAPLRTFLRARLERDEGLELAPDELMITQGASAGLDLAVRLFTQPGDTVLVEAPSYHEALANIRDYPVKLAAVPLDEDGLQVDQLAERIDSLLRAGERPVLLYTIPSFQNPSGVTLSEERRLGVLELAYKYGLRVIEDDVYRDLYFESPPPASLFALDTRSTVIRLGSFSKILAPGLRLGWAMGPAEEIDRMTNCGLLQSGGGANPFAAYVVAAFCERGWLDPHIDRLRQNYRERRDILLAALSRALDGTGVTWTRPGGGFFVWLTLPTPLIAAEALARAQQRGITFLTGEPFHAQGGGERHIRLSFSYVDRPDLVRGTEILAEIVANMLSA
jgi:DNA-binding transcriptional MocR family regulator